MKLIIIHGPPAAGKFTVGTELTRQTGFKLFHNHVSIDCVKTVFEFGTPKFWEVISQVRTQMIAEAARERISLIHTFCYEFGVDDELFRKLITAVEDDGGEVHIVLLLCDTDERRKRIGNESRVRIGKLTDPTSFDRVPKPELSKPLPGRETLIIDTTVTSAADAAEHIIHEYGLERQSASG